MFYKKSVLKNFAKFTRKHLCQSLFFNKVAGLNLQVYKKETLAQGFFCEFGKFFKSVFLTEQLQMIAPRSLRLMAKDMSFFLYQFHALHIITIDFFHDIATEFCQY